MTKPARLATLTAATFALLPATALADVTGHFRLTSKKAGAPSGFFLSLAQDSATAKEIKSLVIRFPLGASLDPLGAVQCTAPLADRAAKGHAAACPAASRIGMGSGAAKVGDQTVPADIGVYNVLGAGGRRVMNFEASTGGHVISAFSGDFKIRDLSFDLGLTLTKLDVTVRSLSRTVGATQRALVRTPRICPTSGIWKMRIDTVYADGSLSRLSDSSPCKRKKSQR